MVWWVGVVTHELRVVLGGPETIEEARNLGSVVVMPLLVLLSGYYVVTGTPSLSDTGT